MTSEEILKCFESRLWNTSTCKKNSNETWTLSSPSFSLYSSSSSYSSYSLTSWSSSYSYPFSSPVSSLSSFPLEHRSSWRLHLHIVVRHIFITIIVIMNSLAFSSFWKHLPMPRSFGAGLANVGPFVICSFGICVQILRIQPTKPGSLHRHLEDFRSCSDVSLIYIISTRCASSVWSLCPLTLYKRWHEQISVRLPWTLASSLGCPGSFRRARPLWAQHSWRSKSGRHIFAATGYFPLMLSGKYSFTP